ncbi:hypothetical protein SANTM175S_07154 [Streptomyces antimycoticus]
MSLAQVLDAIARALILDRSERAHLFALAGTVDPSPASECTGVPQSLRRMLEQSVKTLVMIDMATGFSIEPPIACTMRKMTSISRLGARLHSPDPRVKITSPVWKVRLRPTRSAVDPESIKSAARTRVYASIVHCIPETEACRSLRIEGRATLRTVLSRLTSSRLMQQIASTSMRRRWLSSRMVERYIDTVGAAVMTALSVPPAGAGQ